MHIHPGSETTQKENEEVWAGSKEGNRYRGCDLVFIQTTFSTDLLPSAISQRLESKSNTNNVIKRLIIERRQSVCDIMNAEVGAEQDSFSHR